MKTKIIEFPAPPEKAPRLLESARNHRRTTSILKYATPREWPECKEEGEAVGFGGKMFCFCKQHREKHWPKKSASSAQSAGETL